MLFTMPKHRDIQKQSNIYIKNDKMLSLNMFEESERYIFHGWKTTKICWKQVWEAWLCRSQPQQLGRCEAWSNVLGWRQGRDNVEQNSEYGIRGKDLEMNQWKDIYLYTVYISNRLIHLPTYELTCSCSYCTCSAAYLRTHLQSQSLRDKSDYPTANAFWSSNNFFWLHSGM